MDGKFEFELNLKMSVPNPQQLNDKEDFVLRRSNRQLAKDEWTRELDKLFMESVIRNYFNFDMVATELNQHAKKTGLDHGVARQASREGLFNADKCRVRWSYLHLLVSSSQANIYLAKKRRGAAICSRAHARGRA